MAPITNHNSGLATPLMIKIINSVLDRSRIPPVILGSDEDECVVAGYFSTPGAGVGVRVLGGVFDLGGDAWFVVEGEVPGA